MFSLCLFVVAVGFAMSEAVVSRSRECGHVIRRSFSGIITSHYDFPVGPYPNSYRCLWRIQAPPLYRIKMFTPRMSVEYEPECDFDHLDVYDDVNTSNSSRRLARLCGRERSNYIISSGPYLTLDWTSDSTVAKMGFLIRYEFVPSSSPLVRGGMQRRERYRCSSSDIRCEDGFCVPAKYHCDGINDCSNKADEQGCPTLYPQTTRPTTTRPPTTTKASTTRPPTTTPASGATQSPPSGRSCGVTPIQPDLSEGRVVGGKVAVPGSWPWTISLRLNGGHTCGGSIISPRWVMTAAHCVEGYKNSNQWTIVAGLHAETNLNSKTKTIRVQRIIVHPQWNSQATDYDYTLLYLAQPLSYTNEIQPICLASRILGADVECFVAGWGATKGTGGQGFLKQAFVKTFNHADCQSFYGGVTNRMICAGHREGGRDTCQGDSGGPLMCKIGSNWELHGATSFGGACAAPNSPGVYSRISKITDWARQTMRS